MDEAPAAISLENVTVAFEGRKAALDDLSLKVRRREFVAIVGPSGSGKTTLLRLINRLAQPDSGAVHVEGADVRSVDAIACWNVMEGFRRAIPCVN